MSNTNKAAIEAGTRVPAIFAELGLVNTKPAPSVAGLWHRLNAVEKRHRCHEQNPGRLDTGSRALRSSRSKSAHIHLEAPTANAHMKICANAQGALKLLRRSNERKELEKRHGL